MLSEVGGQLVVSTDGGTVAVLVLLVAYLLLRLPDRR